MKWFDIPITLQKAKCNVYSHVYMISANPYLVRTAAERGVLKSSWEKWSVYRHARNLTSHTYDEAKAKEVCSIIGEFIEEIEFLLQHVETSLNES